jgi:spermidine synthase
MSPTTRPEALEVPARPSPEEGTHSAEAQAQAPVLASRLWHPGVIVFVSNTCVMVLELVAGRIIAPYVGVSLYTWTSVIGVVLAGISLGNYLGGWLADRWASLRLLGAIFLLGGLASLAIRLAEDLGDFLPGSWPVVAQILLLTTALFFLPSMILGGISPLVAKLAVRDLARTGSTLGRIYAAGTFGSIVGTFATGFVLIAWFGTHAIIWGVAVVLLLMGLLFVVAGGARPDRPGAGRRRFWGLLVGLVLVGAVAGLAVQWGALRSDCTRETNYFCIKVRQQDRNGGPMMVLILDRLVHSYTSLTDPGRFVYEYERIYAEATAYQSQHAGQLSALFIGGGGYTFPRYMASKYPGSRVDVIEIDPGVTQIAYERLGLSRSAAITTYNEDARQYMLRAPAPTYNLVMGDAFNDFSVPYHLATRQFDDLVRRWLAPGGLYMVNLIDGPRHDFLRAYLYTLRQSFAHVYVVPGSSEWRVSPRMTYVLIAADSPLDLAELSSIDAGDGETLLADQILSQNAVDALLAEGRTVALTDDYAPVEQLLAPVARNEQTAPQPAP